MKMPTKEELLRLQKIYRTDKKIGEALGGIPEYLVAYWRRKKGIPRPSFAKYSEAQIRELWERFGDDFRCGRELGISKAAFYSWRRKYGIKEKPQALKLEQLELRFGMETKMGTNGTYVEYYQTAYHKIVARAAGRDNVRTGEIVRAEPDLFILPDHIADDGLAHEVESKCWWTRPVGLLQAGDHGSGGSHTLDRPFDCLWKGLIKPNQLIVTTHPELYSLGAFSSTVITLDAEHAKNALDGMVEIRIPPVIKVTVAGKITKNLSVVDLMGFYIYKLEADSFRNRIIEFSGSGIEKMSGEEKMAICYMARLAGAESVFCLFDELTRRFLAQRTKVNDKILFSDRTAHYDAEYLLNSIGLKNLIFPDGNLLNPVQAETVPNQKVTMVFLGGPCGGTADILKAAADLVKGRKAARGVACYVSPITQKDMARAMKKKALTALVDFGFQILPVGMGLEDFLTVGKIKRGLLTVPDRFNPRDDCEITFCSAETAVCSAAEGRIV